MGLTVKIDEDDIALELWRVGDNINAMVANIIKALVDINNVELDVEEGSVEEEICECGDECCTSYVDVEFTDDFDVRSWTTTSTVNENVVLEMDKETFVTLAEAVQQHMHMMEDVKQLVYNQDGHTCGYDVLPNAMIKFLDHELQTDLVSMWFFELTLEVHNAGELYDLIMESRKCW